MKPIHLNLAARPYRDYRPVYAVVVIVSLLTAFLMLNNIETFYRYTHETRSTRAKIAGLEANAQKERKKEQEVQQRLAGLDLARLDAQAKFVNAKLMERAFSWSLLLDELESILADDVRLISVSPSITPNEPVSLALSFESKSSDGMITTVKRMQNDPQFRNVFPPNETRNPAGIYLFTITAEYVPPQQAATGTGKVVSAEGRR